MSALRRTGLGLKRPSWKEPPQTFPPLIQGISIPAGLPLVAVPNFFSFVWPAGAPPGTYSFALFAAPPGAFGDGSIDQGDVTAVGLDSLTF